MNLKNDKELINKIILNKKIKCWNWYMQINHEKNLKFREYIQSVRELQKIKKKYNIIYIWYINMKFMEKCWKYLEYYEYNRMHPESEYIKNIINNF